MRIEKIIGDIESLLNLVCVCAMLHILNVCVVTLAVDVVYRLWSHAAICKQENVGFDESPTYLSSHEYVLEDI